MGNSLSRPRAERLPHDSYFTPPALATAIVERLAKLQAIRADMGGGWCEPSCGDGAFVNALDAQWPTEVRVSVDLVPRPHALVIARFQDYALRHREAFGARFSLVCGNPPFSEAEEFVRSGLTIVAGGGHVAHLLRLNFLGSQSRIGFWKELPAKYVIPIVPRPSFGLNRHGKPGTDGAEYAVFVWRRGFRGSTRILQPLVWRKERSKLRAVAGGA